MSFFLRARNDRLSPSGDHGSKYRVEVIGLGRQDRFSEPQSCFRSAYLICGTAHLLSPTGPHRRPRCLVLRYAGAVTATVLRSDKRVPPTRRGARVPRDRRHAAAAEARTLDRRSQSFSAQRSCHEIPRRRLVCTATRCADEWRAARGHGDMRGPDVADRAQRHDHARAGGRGWRVYAGHSWGRLRCCAGDQRPAGVLQSDSHADAVR